jgi:hypothetical protein
MNFAVFRMKCGRVVMKKTDQLDGVALIDRRCMVLVAMSRFFRDLPRYFSLLPMIRHCWSRPAGVMSKRAKHNACAYL